MKPISYLIRAAGALVFMAAYGTGIPAQSQALNTYYSVVNADGTKVRGSGAHATIHIGTGTYEVDFAQNLTFCSWLAVPGVGDASAAGAAYATTALRAGHTAGIFVQTFDSTGALADKPFIAAAYC